MIEHLPTKASEFDEVVAFYNQKSTNGAETLEFAKDCLGNVQYGLPIRYFETSSDPDEMIDIFGRYVDPKANTLTGVVGGDYTINLVNRARSALAEEYSNTALWAIAGGGAANFLKSTIDKAYLSRPDLAIKYGEIISFNTVSMESRALNGDMTYEEIVSTIGFHGTHHMIDGVDSPSHRASRIRNIHVGRHAIGAKIADPLQVIKGAIKAPASFEYQNEDNEEISSFEKIVINTPIVANIIRASEVSLSGPAHIVDIRRRRNVPEALWRLRQGRSRGHDLQEPVVFTPNGDVGYQVDGDSRKNDERLIIKAGSTVKLWQSEEPTGILQLDLSTDRNYKSKA